MLISAIPLPRISGTKIATTPHITAAINVNTKGDKAVFAAIVADLNSASINSIAMTPNNSPLANKIGTICNKSVAAASSANNGSPPKMAVANQTEVMLEIAIGVSALKEKCRKMASCANTMPAIGA